MNARMSSRSVSMKMMFVCLPLIAASAGMAPLVACSDFEPAVEDIPAAADVNVAPLEDEGGSPDQGTGVDNGGPAEQDVTADVGMPHVHFEDAADTAVAVDDPGFAGEDPGSAGVDAGTDEAPPPEDNGVDPIEDPGCPGYVGCDCEQPEDCLSGLCVPTPDGHRCTRMCTTGNDCEEDELCRVMNNDQGPDATYACLNRWPTACRPCVDDGDCEAPWLDPENQPACVSGGNNDSFCAPIADDITMECPEGYSVERMELDRGWNWICLPDSGACPCTAAWQHAGYEMNCSRTSEFGTCIATRLCHEECGAPEAGPEVCDSLDNDCNGLVDDAITGHECDLVNSIGTCVGHRQCANGVEICLGAAAVTETCDGVDNDCDGLTDEGLGQTKCGVGRCEHTVDNCAGGRFQICNPVEYVASETCNGIDDDCDGRTDEEMGQVTCGMGICTKTVDKCYAGKLQTCVPYPALQIETCDAKDNDCDGLTDEGYGVVTCGLGPCRHTVDTCDDGVPDTCDPWEGATMEVCNGMDEDCDGNIDNAIAYSANLMEPNNSLGGSINLGDVFEGDPTRTFNAMIYPLGDTDYYSFEAVEDNHSCPLGWDQDYKITVTLFNPVGPFSCHGQMVTLYNSAGAVIAADLGASCLSHTVEFKWDGECGPNDSREFFVKIEAHNESGVSCMPYALNLTMSSI